MTESIFSIKNFESHKKVTEAIFSIKNFKSHKKVTESIFGIKNFKAMMMSFFRIKILRVVRK